MLVPEPRTSSKSSSLRNSCNNNSSLKLLEETADFQARSAYVASHPEPKQPRAASDTPSSSLHQMLFEHDTWSLCNGVRWAANLEFAQDITAAPARPQ